MADINVRYTNEFRGIKRNLCFEVELESTADIFNKIGKYEEYSDDNPGIELVIVCKYKRTIDRINSRSYDLPVQAIDIHHISEQFSF